MPTEEESQGFKVTDRRASQHPEEAKGSESVSGPGWQMRDVPSEKALPKMDFTTFCLSLASSAMIHLGIAPDPEGAQRQPNLPLAKQTIDILELLEAKTKGNLTGSEESLLGTLLYDLRLRYVEATK